MPPKRVGICLRTLVLIEGLYKVLITQQLRAYAILATEAAQLLSSMVLIKNTYLADIVQCLCFFREPLR